ncbi:hypothetical protein [Pseudomonas maioricensis]|uniref:hypothetical protein n=1 Tax=Pseudomonas maioricensis TaxID=1766623 RepID=UPI001FABEE5B|nr:hypothetical protein [Pseudomonas sp. S25]
MSTDDRPASPEQASLSSTTDDGDSTPGFTTKEQYPPVPGDSDDEGSIDSGCPGGGTSGGVCTPFNNQYRSSWMSSYNGARYLRIADAILPGTHNSGFDKEAPYSNSFETCQDVSPYKQIMTGIRVLDLRVQFFSGVPAGSPDRFQIFHSLVSQRTVDGDILGEVLRFRTHTPGAGNPKQEIIVLNFHRFNNFTVAAHLELHQLIKSRLNDILIPPWMSELTIHEIWEYNNPAIVIAYGDGQRDPLFWPGVNQRWMGQNTPSTDELKAFMDRVAQEEKPHDELRAIQCAKYNKVVFTPDDFSDKVRQWFYSDNRTSYIQNFFIINTDWSLRQRLIDNCIHANVQKALRLRPIITIHITQSESFTLPGGNRAMIALSYNGHWTKVIHLPPYISSHATILIKNTATYSTEVDTTRTDFPFDSMPLHTGDILSLTAINGTLRHRILAPTYMAEQNNPAIPAPRAHEKLIHYQLADGYWSERIQLAAMAPDSSIVEISSSATLVAILVGSNMVNGQDIRIASGFSEYFVFHAQSGVWEKITRETDPPPELIPPRQLRIALNNSQPIVLDWDWVPAAVKYKVYRWWTEIEETPDLRFRRTMDGYGRFHVRAVDAAGNLSEKTNYVYNYPPS